MRRTRNLRRAQHDNVGKIAARSSSPLDFRRRTCDNHCVPNPAETNRDPAIRVVLLPRDTNPQGTIFGGIILSYIDQAGAVEARKVAPRKFVTVAMREVEFHQPVFVGDVVSFYTQTTRVGRTSVTVQVEVEAMRASDPKKIVKVTSAEVVYVAIDDHGHPMAVREG
jgi:acyl-CoA thioesterase YciA